MNGGSCLAICMWDRADSFGGHLGGRYSTSLRAFKPLLKLCQFHPAFVF